MHHREESRRAHLLAGRVRNGSSSARRTPAGASAFTTTPRSTPSPGCTRRCSTRPSACSPQPRSFACTARSWPPKASNPPSSGWWTSARATALAAPRLRALGVGELIGIDLEPMAARSGRARSVHGSTTTTWSGTSARGRKEELDDLRRRAPTALLALSAVGVGHVPPQVLGRALSLLGPGGIYGFAVHPRLLPDSDDPAGRASGIPGLPQGAERQHRTAPRGLLRAPPPAGRLGRSRGRLHRPDPVSASESAGWARTKAITARSGSWPW